jgi:hypothetical protein
MTSGRPEPGEYGEHAAADIARVAGVDAIEALRQQEGEVQKLFGNLEDPHVRYAPGKWTLKEVLGHLTDDERIFAYRALCIARGDTHPLESFDENAYVAGANFNDRTVGNLLDEYSLVRRSSIALFDSLSPDSWLRRGTVAGYTASVRGLAFHIAGHELHHLAIVRERYLS